MKRLPAVLAAVLCAALACAALLAVGPASGAGPGGAQPAAKSQTAAGEAAALRSVLPDAACGVYVGHRYAAGGADTLVYYRGYRSADTTGLAGYVVKVRGRGYNGYVETVAGVDPAGRIVGLKVVSQRETPGLGDKIVQVKPTKTGNPGPARIAVAFDAPAGGSRCVVVGIRDAAVLQQLEKAVAAGDTAVAAQLATRALALADTTVLSEVMTDRRAAFALAANATRRLREEAVPWWQEQFAGKSAAQLVLSRQKNDASIQGVSGATVSSRAVVEPLKAALTRLEQAVGGFGEGSR